MRRPVKIALISDIHSNTEALKTALAYIEETGSTRPFASETSLVMGQNLTSVAN